MRFVQEADRAIEWDHRGERADENPTTAEYWDRKITPCTLNFCPLCCEIEPLVPIFAFCVPFPTLITTTCVSLLTTAWLDAVWRDSL